MIALNSPQRAGQSKSTDPADQSCGRGTDPGELLGDRATTTATLRADSWALHCVRLIATREALAHRLAPSDYRPLKTDATNLSHLIQENGLFVRCGRSGGGQRPGVVKPDADTATTFRVSAAS
jgi:hypothetical protein